MLRRCYSKYKMSISLSVKKVIETKLYCSYLVFEDLESSLLLVLFLLSGLRLLERLFFLFLSLLLDLLDRSRFLPRSEELDELDELECLRLRYDLSFLRLDL